MGEELTGEELMGEELEPPEVVTVVPPEPEWAKRLLGLYRLWDRANASGAWAADLVSRLAGPSSASNVSSASRGSRRP